MLQCKFSLLKEALLATFEARGDKLPPNISLTISKIKHQLLKRGWENATAGIQEKLDFNIAFDQIITSCKGLD